MRQAPNYAAFFHQVAKYKNEQQNAFSKRFATMNKKRGVKISLLLLICSLGLVGLLTTIYRISSENSVLIVKNTPRRIQLKKVTSVSSQISMNGYIKYNLSESSVVVHDYANAQYVGTIQVGNPAVDVDMVFDTGSSNVWVPSSECVSRSCKLHNTYDHSKSKSYISDGRDFTITYGSGNVSGYISRDDLNLAGIKLKTYEFAEIMNADGLGLGYYTAYFDGIFGLAFENIAIDGIKPAFIQMVEEGLLAEPIFAFRLGRGTGEDGELLLGGYTKEDYIGDIMWTAVVHPSFWQVAIQLSYEGQFISTATVGIVDSGTSLLIGPSKEVAQFALSIGAYKIATFSSYFIECSKISTLAPLKIHIGLNELILPAAAFIQSFTSITFMPCMLMIGEMDLKDNSWILGDVFMREYFTIFNLGEKNIGFAKSSMK